MTIHVIVSACRTFIFFVAIQSHILALSSDSYYKILDPFGLDGIFKHELQIAMA